MRNDTYVLDLLVTGAAAVSVIDDGTGIDTIRVSGVYSATIDIDLAWTIVNGTPYSAASRYVSAQNTNHQLVVFGQIENAFGSNGTEFISGNDLANVLGGDQKQTGRGGADTIWGAGGNDSLYGGAGNDIVNGDADNDMLWGDAGKDSLSGGAGRDTLIGGVGADRLDGGGDAGDTLSYANSRHGVYVNLRSDGITLGRGGDAQGDQISGFTNVTGSAAADRIVFLDKTTLPNGQSNNQVYGGDGKDRIVLGGGNDLGFGGLGNDVLSGELGDDTLVGDSGMDRLYGGLGQDFMTGGADADRFVFATTSASSAARPDVITDFSAADQDKIDLKAIDAVLGVAGNQAFQLITGDFTGVAGQLRMQVQGSDLALYADTNGDRLADFGLILRDCHVVTATDFVL